MQSGPHDAPGELQGVPEFGMTAGQPMEGEAQNNWGGSMVWQIG